MLYTVNSSGLAPMRNASCFCSRFRFRQRQRQRAQLHWVLRPKPITRACRCPRATCGCRVITCCTPWTRVYTAPSRWPWSGGGSCARCVLHCFCNGTERSLVTPAHAQFLCCHTCRCGRNSKPAFKAAEVMGRLLPVGLICMCFGCGK